MDRLTIHFPRKARSPDNPLESKQQAGANPPPRLLTCERQAGGPDGPTLPLAGGEDLTPTRTPAVRATPTDLSIQVQRVADACARNPDDFSNVRDAARQLLVLGRHDQAEQLLSWHIELHPFHGEAYAMMQYVRLLTGIEPEGDLSHSWQAPLGHHFLRSNYLCGINDAGVRLESPEETSELNLEPMDAAMSLLHFMQKHEGAGEEAFRLAVARTHWQVNRPRFGPRRATFSRLLFA